MKRKRYYKSLTIPAIRKYRDAIERGDIGKWLIDSCEEVGAGSAKIKYSLKRRPYIVTLEAKRNG